jgi:hypothetical protein
MYTQEQLDNYLNQQQVKQDKILIQLYFLIMDIEEDIYTNSFPIEEIEKRIEEIKRIIGENLKD